MNDPGLAEPIEDAENVTHQARGDWAEEVEEEDLLLYQSRWWFASTACPLIAGTFGPMSSAFNLCALLEKWREYLPDGATEDTGVAIQDPSWLLAINGISLGFALIANVALLLNMVGRLKFKYAQPITIVGFGVAAILLIILVAVASSSVFRIEPRSDHALTQAFYYACYAAGLYTIIAILMTITVYGALVGKYPKRFEISNSQRTLMLQTISFMAYLLVGAAIYSSLEGWYFLDAVFWADFTLLTIGLGSPLVPVTHAGRSLIFPFTFGGILAVGLVIGSIRSMLLEKGAQKMHARATEKQRQRIVKLKDADVGRSRFSWLRRKNISHKRMDAKDMPERTRREEEFHAMRNIQEHAAKKQKWMALAFSTTNAAVLWFIGALVFWYTEYKQGWTYFQAMYFSYTTLITLGYGDFQPLSNSGKSFFVFWSLLAIPTLTVLISDMGDTVVKAVAEATNWLGSLTITPGDKDFWHKLRQNLNLATGGLLFRSHSPKHKQKAHLLQRSRATDDDDRIGKFPDLLYARLHDTERSDIAAYGRDPAHSTSEKDTILYHFLLVKEIRSVLSDVRSSAPKQYTYDEWAYFLKLIGQDEEDDRLHTRRYNKPKKDGEEAPQVGRIVDHEGTAREWSWLSLRSPLLSQMSESEWILHRLLEKLHGEMHISKHSRTRRGGRKGSGPLRQTDQLATSTLGDRRDSDEKGHESENPALPVSMSLFLRLAGVSSQTRERAEDEARDSEDPERQGKRQQEMRKETEDDVAEGRGDGSGGGGAGGKPSFLAIPPFTTSRKRTGSDASSKNEGRWGEHDDGGQEEMGGRRSKSSSEEEAEKER